MWGIGKMVEPEPRDGGRARIPDLVVKDQTGIERSCTSNQDKQKVFEEAFFPPAPEKSPVPEHTIYPPPAWNFAPPTNRMIATAIQRMKSSKATRPGTIPNDLFKKCSAILVPHLGPIHRATYTLGVYPDSWSMIETLVQRKPGKPDYRRPNAWRPIALSDGHGRLANSCLAIILTSKAELLGLIPSLQFGARPGRSTTDSIHLMIDRIKQLWREGNVVSVLFMDVKGAFPSVNLKMMYHELRLLGVPQEITAWLQRRYANRYTRITFDDYISDPIRILGGEDQGDPNAGIAYILYAAGLLKKFEGRDMEEGYGFMDDVAAKREPGTRRARRDDGEGGRSPRLGKAAQLLIRGG